MLTVENTPENGGRARQKRARLALKIDAKKTKKQVDNSINQLIDLLQFELSGYFSINNS
jgi:hypothetical protein